MELVLSTKCGRLGKSLIEKTVDTKFFKPETSEPDKTEVYIRFSEGVPVEVGCWAYDNGMCRINKDKCLYGGLKIKMQQQAPKTMARG